MESSLFVWRKVDDLGTGEAVEEDFIRLATSAISTVPRRTKDVLLGQSIELKRHFCPFCRVEMNVSYGDGYADQYEIELECARCGWTIVRELCWDWGKSVAHHFFYRGTLVEFKDLNDLRLGLDELGAHIHRHPRDLNSINWRRFEELTGSVFKDYGGWEVTVTQPSKDDGADLILFSNNSRQAIVQCKRTSAKIQVDIVRELVGVCVDFQVKKGYLATTSDFTKGSKSLAERYLARGYEVDLVAAQDVVEMLGVYNKVLEPLSVLSEEEVRSIQQSDVANPK